MNVLFLTLIGFDSINESNIYADLLREFITHRHHVYIVSPAERRQGIKTGLIEEENSTILRVKTGNIQKTNIIEKGISTVMLESQFVAAIKKYFGSIKFDLILYSTPPITIAKAVEYVKKRDKATTYLMLKDIFPQNAVDLGMMSVSGIKGLIYRFFRNKEKNLYKISDYIGCMSPANVDYIINHNSDINPSKVEICPNCVEIQDRSISIDERNKIRKKYDIPLDKTVFVYGGNLGKPQGIPFIIECLKNQQENNDVFFLIVGSGTEFGKLMNFFESNKPRNMKLMSKIPKDDYDLMIAACDVGLIFLDHRFTIPNFPSRLLGYMQAGLPVFAATDSNTDVGDVIVNGDFGWWCESNDVKSFSKLIDKIVDSDLNLFGLSGKIYLKKNYDVRKAYEIIVKRLEHV